MATTQHIFDLLNNKQTQDTKLTSDLVKYFVDIFGSPKALTQLQAGTTPLPLMGQVVKHEEVDDVIMSSPESSPIPVDREGSPPVSGVSPPRVSSPGDSPSNGKDTSPTQSSANNHGTKQVFEKPSMECVKYVMGKRGGCQIVWQGHRYTRDRTRNDQTYWACVLKRPPYRCKGRISTKRSFVTSATAHNHTHQTSKSQTARLIHQLKQKVRGSCTEAEAPDIVLSCLQEFKFNETSLNEELPSYDTLVKMCKRIVKNKKKSEDDVLMSDGCSTNILSGYPGNQLDYLLNPNAVLNMDLENCDGGPRKSLSEMGHPILSSLGHLPAKMDTSEDLVRRQSLTAAGLGMRSPLVPTQLPAPGPGFLNGLLPPTLPLSAASLPPPPSLSSMVPNFLSSTPFPTIRSTQGSAFTSTTSSNSLLPTSSSIDSLKIASALASNTSGSEETTIFSTPSAGITSSNAALITPSSMAGGSRPHHVTLLEKGVSSISEVRSYLDDIENLYRARISEMQLIEEDFKSFKEDSKSKDDRIQCLQREVSKLDVALKVAQEGLQKVRCTSEDKVERSLMKTFFTQYITAPDSRKPEVLRLMTSILNYSDEEMEALHRSRDKKWLSGIFPTSVAGAVSGVPPPTADIQPGQSFSELFVSFLETEANRGSVMGSRPLSSPPPSLRAPATGPHHQRSPSSSVSFHQRSPSSTSTTSNNSLPVSLSTTTKESCPLAEMGPQSDPTILTPGAPSLQTLHTSPLVVPASLADLLSKR